MNFRLTTLLYVFALFAAAMATFGPGAGIVLALVVTGVQIGWSTIKRHWFALTALLLGAVVIIFGGPLAAIQSKRTPSLSNMSRNQLKQLTLAMDNYHDVHGHYPPPYTQDDDGQPLHSWRTLLLPDIEEQALYQKINLNEPWDSPANKAVFQRRSIALLQSPRIAKARAKDETHYLAVVDEATIWNPDGNTTRVDITDGATETIAILEVSGLGIPWYEPRDLTMQQAVDLLCGEREVACEFVRRGFFVSDKIRTKTVRPDGLYPRLFVFAGGRTERTGYFRTRDMARGWLTTAGGEELEEAEMDWNYKYGEERIIGHIIHWGRIWGLAVFVALAIGPRLRPAAKPKGDQ